ncbi:MAG: ATP-dependent DNA helicase RecG [Ruminococcus sp.]|nr:ATP-dependent DNA helicase RecG [Ruminococcus sp.]
MPSLYKTPVTALDGVGEKRAALFEKLGVKTVGDLIEFYPRTYKDWSVTETIEKTFDGGLYCIKAVVGMPVTDSRISGGRILSKTVAYDSTGTVQLVFFNNRFISAMLRAGEEYFFYGRISFTPYGKQMVSPMFANSSQGAKIYPVYRQTAGLVTKTIRGCVDRALKMLPEQVNDPIPEQVRKHFDLIDLKQALFSVHFPENREALDAARKRLITEELLVLNLGMRDLKTHSRGISKAKIETDFSAEFEKLLPFELTGAQKRAVADCVADMTQKNTPMNRLVQGDVGSGKTAVAASVCYTVIKNGMQTAFMAPTEILARQHYETFKKLFSNTGVKVDLLVGALRESEKKQVRERLQNGETDLVIGTHAIITEKTVFKNLGLAIADEQHRFGVAQRANLLGKGDNPHLLVMSATPIPRTLGLIIFGDLDISVIDELPPSRKPVKTLLISSEQRGRAYSFIKKEIAEGRQAYIVCPLVEEGELENVASAEEYAAELMLREFSEIPVGLVHGQMKSAEKEAVMEKFAANELSLIVATTVIEVGVDVPNASVMMIENAERFGLSQLHQLRGRVGRGDAPSYCVLVSDNQSDKTGERLKIMCETNDGFKIADEDLKMRGPGDFFGQRQHGLPQLSIADFADSKSLELSQKTADYIMYIYKDLRCDELRLLKAEVDRLFGRGGANSLN